MTGVGMIKNVIGSRLLPALATLLAFGLAPSFAADKVAAEFGASLGAFRVSRAPVMLPAWLPAYCGKKPLGMGMGPFKNGYEWWFGSSSADTAFFGSGGEGQVKHSKRAVDIGQGRVAYVNYYKNDCCLEWQSGKYCYRLGMHYSVPLEPDLVKVAKSVVLVPQSVLKSAPVGDDLLAKAYATEAEMQAQSQRAKLAEKFEQGLVAFANADNDVAEKNFRDVIAHYSEGPELPPVTEVQIALTNVLRSTGRDAEAAKYEQQFSSQAAADRQELEKDVAQCEKVVQQAKDNTTGKIELSSARRKLGKFLMVQLHFDESEKLLNDSYANAANVYGPQAWEARLAKQELDLLNQMRNTAKH